MQQRERGAATEWQNRLLAKEASKELRAQEKKKKLEAKQAWAKLARSRKKHNELWSSKIVKALGDKLHAAIQQNAPVVG